MKLSQIKTILAMEDIQLTKSLGQNFLFDGNQVRRILEAAELKPEDSILEIGPGLGPLTEQLLVQVKRVCAIEKDQRLFSFLQRRLGSHAALQLILADVMDYFQTARDWSEWKMVANLPYSVASSILVELARMMAGPKRVACTLQLEVARRLAAQPGEPDYGLFTLLVQLGYECKGWFKIPASCFFPQPGVDSACVTLVRRAHSILDEERAVLFTHIVKRSFSQRRKMMLKLLKADWNEERLVAAFQQVNLPVNIRAEAVGLEAFVGLAKYLPALRD